MIPAFDLRAVAHLMEPWGRSARDLEQLRSGLVAAPDTVLFHHAVQYPLRNPRAEELALDDLSAWVRAVVQDAETAERLSFAVQTQGATPSLLRNALLEVLDRLTEKHRVERAAPEGSEFVFLSSLSVSFPTGRSLDDAQQAVDALVGDDPSVWFYHLIEEPWYAGRTPLLEWLEQAGEKRLAKWLREATVSGLPIEIARTQLMRRWSRSQIARRLSEATASPEHERREAGRRAVARLVRRRPRASEQP